MENVKKGIFGHLGRVQLGAVGADHLRMEVADDVGTIGVYTYIDDVNARRLRSQIDIWLAARDAAGSLAHPDFIKLLQDSWDGEAAAARLPESNR